MVDLDDAENWLVENVITQPSWKNEVFLLYMYVYI